MTLTIRKAWNFLGSRDLSVFIFITALTYILFLVSFSSVVPSWWVNNISNLLPFKVLYSIFFINLVVCEIKWIPVVIRRCRRPEAPMTEEDLRRFSHRIQISGQLSAAGRLERYLKRRGYGVKSAVRNKQSEGHDSRGISQFLYAYRGRLSPVGNLLFHFSFIFILVGVFVSVSYRIDRRQLLMEGQESSGLLKEYGVSSGGTNSIASFEVVDIRPEFWKEKLLFTDMAARLKYNGKEDVARLSEAVRINGARVTIEGIGYTPKYILKDVSGRELDTGYVNLANFVPGSVDFFQIPGFPYKIYVSIYPDFEMKGRKISVRSMNLKNPMYFLRVVRNKSTVYSGLLRPYDSAQFDGLSISFPEIRYNGTFHIVRDPGSFLIWTGFILMVSGLVWRLFFYRKEVLVCFEEDLISLYINCDYYPRLVSEECLAILREASPATYRE